MPQPRSRPLPHSKVGQEYQRLTEKIQTLRQEITAWEQCLSDIQQRARQEVLPLQDQYAEELLELFALLEEQLQDRKLRWGKVQRVQAWESLAWFAAQAQELVGATHAEAFAAFCQRCQAEVGIPEEDEEDPEEAALFQALLESMGIPEEEAREAVRRGSKSPAGEAGVAGRPETTGESEDPRAPDWEAFFRQAGAKQAEEQRKKDQKTAAELRNHTLLRSWYRRLVSMLHPDREPDPQERQRKTRQLQELHQAYQSGDAWQILQQVEALGIATEVFAGDAGLKMLNQGLRKQQRRLQEQLQQIRWELQQHFGLPPFGKLTPEILEAHYARDVEEWQERIRTTQGECIQLAANPAETKQWLRELHRQHKAWVREQQWWYG